MTSLTQEWTATVEVDPDTGDLILPIPSDLMTQRSWVEGDMLEWTINSDGSCSIEKLKN